MGTVRMRGKDHETMSTTYSPSRDQAMDPGWAAQAKCGTSDPDELFVKGAAQQSAKQVCQGCPVIAECLADALDSRVEFGVWGGKTERERRALLRQHPEVTSWWNLFANSRVRRAS